MPLPVQDSIGGRPTARSLAYERLRDWIEEGVLTPGEPLTETDVANALGVSRTPVREALQTLAQQALVELSPGRGYRVAPLGAATWSDVLEPLASLETIAAQLAADRATPSEIRELRSIHERFARAVSERDEGLVRELDDEFHGLIVEASRNPYLVEPIGMLRTHWRRFEVRFFPGGSSIAVDDHLQILVAIEQGDAAGAVLAESKNWGDTRDQFLSMLGPRVPGSAGTDPNGRGGDSR